jgi:hypothetical protein
MTLLARMLVVLVLGVLCGCSGQRSAQPQTTATVAHLGGDLVYTTGTEVGIVRGGKVVARLPWRNSFPGQPDVVPLTKDGRFLYSVGDTSVSVLDTRSLERREVSCDSACQGSLKPLAPLGGSLVGGFDLGGIDGETGVAAVKALDLAAADPKPKTLGQVKLAFPRPTQPEVQPYSFFLDAATGEYLFLDFTDVHVPEGRLWGQRQTLHLARLDGTLLDLGDYSFPASPAVWGAISPDGRQFAVGDWNYEAAKGTSDERSHGTGVNLFDASAGEKKTTIAPPFEAQGPCGEPGAAPGRYKALGARWGRSGVLYATFQQWPCAHIVPGKPREDPGPVVWAYRDGQWSRVATPGAAIQAIDLGEGRLAVVAAAHSTQTGYTTEYDTSKGSLFIVDSHGVQTHIVDSVTALAEIPPTGM